MAVSRRRLLRAAGVLGVAGSAGCPATPTAEEGEGRTSGEGRTGGGDGVDTATDDAPTTGEPRDYDTVRGRDRNEVVLDGGFEREYAIEVTADGVAVENLTGRFYRETPFYWTGVEGFRGSFLTAHNNGYYGIYAYGSRDGRFEHSYASGHPDAGFYLGRNRPYDAVISDVVAEHNAIGYSGTSTGGPLTVTDSVWRYNKVGVFPNTLDRADPPQRSTGVVGTEIYGNDDAAAPALESYPLLGMGVLLWGGSDNVVADNRVTGSDRADLALGRPAGDGNDFRGNELGTSLPPGIQSDASEGSAEVTDVFVALERQVETGEFPAGDWRDQPVPGDQPSMPDPEAPPRPAEVGTSLAAPRAQTDGYGME